MAATTTNGDQKQLTTASTNAQPAECGTQTEHHITAQEPQRHTRLYRTLLHGLDQIRYREQESKDLSLSTFLPKSLKRKKRSSSAPTANKTNPSASGKKTTTSAPIAGTVKTTKLADRFPKEFGPKVKVEYKQRSPKTVSINDRFPELASTSPGEDRVAAEDGLYWLARCTGCGKLLEDDDAVSSAVCMNCAFFCSRCESWQVKPTDDDYICYRCRYG